MLISSRKKKRKKIKKEEKKNMYIPAYLTTRRTGDRGMKYTPRNDIISLIIIIGCRPMIYAPFLLLHGRARLRGRNVTLNDESRKRMRSLLTSMENCARCTQIVKVNLSPTNFR